MDSKPILTNYHIVAAISGFIFVSLLTANRTIFGIYEVFGIHISKDNRLIFLILSFVVTAFCAFIAYFNGRGKPRKDLVANENNLTSPQPPVKTSDENANADLPLLNQIEKAKKLLDSSTITEDEFNKIKGKIINP